MALDDPGMHRAGLAFAYRITPVLVTTILYVCDLIDCLEILGIYICLLGTATRGLWLRGLNKYANIVILFILYVLFLITSALWALEVAQLMGLVDLLLKPKDLSTTGQFNIFYALIARETKVTSVLFEIQTANGINTTMLVGTDDCSGVSSTNYSQVCKVTQSLAPTLSIVTNVSVMLLTMWKAWLIRDAFKQSFQNKQKSKVFSIFVLLIESGTLYVVMLIADLIITSYVVGENETVARMISCISGYSTVQLVAIYPTLMLVILRESIWNSSDDDDIEVLSVSRMQFASNAIRYTSAGTIAQFTENSIAPMEFGGEGSLLGKAKIEVCLG
ncbi:hypothetical protein GYMLUDRAFT_89171 [Collybiopsis luxurians FD-317 M1]|uniref:Uncharacterized protein n=1 Tax=Collybiopsis luxurians FD-317 M1 TaxID=944289 RepID=A0A0D0C8F7_9AGAR|nr:hypothetical protein GYMLUDRAFT_89171 [Collybiopsis luxurians FD-317 M1]